MCSLFLHPRVSLDEQCDINGKSKASPENKQLGPSAWFRLAHFCRPSSSQMVSVRPFSSVVLTIRLVLFLPFAQAGHGIFIDSGLGKWARHALT